jgi:RHS repeat-associated protein
VAAGYDSLNRTAWLQGAASGSTTKYVGDSADATKWTSYFPHGAPYKIWYGNALVRTWGSYNQRLQPTAFWDAIHDNGNYFLRVERPSWVDGNGHNNGNLQHTSLYELYAAGPGPGPPAKNVDFTENFDYDALNRLVAASDSGGWYRQFQYDRWGNMSLDANSATGPVLNPNTPTSQQLFNAKNQRNDQTYDAAGNLLGLLSAPNIGLTYDAENRQVSAGAYTYAYDGDGRRVSKTGGGVATVFVYDAMGVLAAEYSNGSLGAGKCTTCYLTYDHLGSVRLITDANYNVISRHDYLPFGEEVPAATSGRDGTFGTANDFVNQKFTAKERDSESGLDYFGARYYGSALGRWTSPDWSNAPEPVPYADLSNPQTLNQYTYVLNNPLAHVDDDGHCSGFVRLFGEHFCNFADYGHFVSDANLEKALADDAKKAQAYFLKHEVQLQDQKTGKKMYAADVTAGHTNKEIVDLYNWERKQEAFLPPPGPMLGANGTQVTSKTLWNNGGERIDVENPNPGQRPGQIHYQDGSGKYIYNVGSGEFEGLSASQSKQLMSKPGVQEAIQKGLKYLGAQ